MSENYHAMKFSTFKRHCKHSTREGAHWQVECTNKGNKMQPGYVDTKPCSKHYCPVFRKAFVIRGNVVGGIDRTSKWYGE